MKRILFGLIVLAFAASAPAQVFRVAASTDYPFTFSLLDSAGARVTEKKPADTTITYTNVTDSNTPSANWDDTGHWTEIGDGTGDYKLLMGGAEFTEAGHVYFVKITVAGTTGVQFRVETPVSAASHYRDLLIGTEATWNAQMDAWYTASATKTSVDAILTDTAAIDTATELRTLLTGEDKAVAKQETLTDSTYGLSALKTWLLKIYNSVWGR